MTQEEKPFRWLSEPEQRAWRAYLGATARLQQRIDRDLQQASGIPHAYYMILAMLSEAPERAMRMTDLAELLSSSPSRLSHAIRKLVELGWIRKDADPADGRVAWACLTDEGMSVVVDAAPGHVTTVVGALFDRLTPEQVEQLRTISEAMLAGADEDG
jgi:DNA-binding MarR family transcriptional regulator